MDAEALGKLKVPDLRKLLTDRNLDSKGKKDELIARLLENGPIELGSGGGGDNSAEDVEDEGAEETGEAAVAENSGEAAETTEAARAAEGENGAEAAEEAEAGDGENPLLMSEADRRKLREDRWGAEVPAVPAKAAPKAKPAAAGAVPVSNDKLSTREARFGIAAESNGAGSKRAAVVEVSAAEQEKRTKREERFGVTKEELSKRKSREERFTSS